MEGSIDAQWPLDQRAMNRMAKILVLESKGNTDFGGEEESHIFLEFSTTIVIIYRGDQQKSPRTVGLLGLLGVVVVAPRQPPLIPISNAL